MTWLLVFVLFANPRSDANQPVVSQVSVESRELCERGEGLLCEPGGFPPAQEFGAEEVAGGLGLP